MRAARWGGIFRRPFRGLNFDHYTGSQRGTSGDIAELFVVCTACKTEQSMVRATIYDRATGLGALGRSVRAEYPRPRRARSEQNTPAIGALGQS